MPKNNLGLITVKIQNKNYGALSGVEILITGKLKQKLESIKKKDGTNLFTNLETRGFQGGKHLIELLKAKFGNSMKLILSDQISGVDGNNITINYESFNIRSRNKFFNVYRQTGLEAALEFLQAEFSEKFPQENIEATKKETKRVIYSLKETSTQLSSADKTRLVKEFSATLPELRVKDSEALKEVQAATNQSYYKNQLAELERRLGNKYPETKGKNSWQSWIYQNTWLYGANYLKALEKKKVGFDQIPDYLFLTTDGFLDILEIKIPEKIIIRKDSSHAGSYFWDNELSKAIGQIVNYLYQIELHQLEIAKNLKKIGIEVMTIKPRAIILVGRSEEWSEEEKEALRKLNFSLHGIEVLTYDQLLDRGKRLISIYDRKVL